MGSLFKAPSPPPAPVYEAPPEPPSYEDEARAKQAAEDERRRQAARKGRRSTILTGTGLSEEATTEKKTLLGG
jgi:hypothetical protein